MKITLTPEHERFVHEMVSGGRYVSASEVVCHALWLLDDHEKLRQIRLEDLRKEVAIGIEQMERGEVVPFDPEAIKAKARARLRAPR